MIPLRVGIDVGETNVDAVVIDPAGTVQSTAKVRRGASALTAIDGALGQVLATLSANENPDPSAALRGTASQIVGVMIATDHARHALDDPEGLEPVAVVRIGAAASRAVRPLFGWPERLRDAAAMRTTLIEGGSEVDGRSAAPLDVDALRAFLLAGPPPRAVALTAVFAVASPEVELQAAQVVHQTLGAQTRVSMSHEIGAGSLLARENVTVLNAALGATMRRFADDIRAVTDSHALSGASHYAVRNDGYLMSLAIASHFPVLSINARPAAAILGARALADVHPALVIDIGGSSTTLGLVSGEDSRSAPVSTLVAGIELDVRLSDTVTAPFGGRTLDDANAAPSPSVRDELARYAARLRNEHGLLSVIAVGGAAAHVPDQLPGTIRTLRPDHGDVAGALGAAVADVGSEHERIVNVGSRDHLSSIAVLEAIARRHAVRAGADPRYVRTTDVEEVPLTYLGGEVARLRVRAAGPPRGTHHVPEP